MRRALLLIALIGTVVAGVSAARAADSKAVVVEFQPVTDDDAGIAYLLYASVAESLLSEGRSDLVVGEDVEMYLGSAAEGCAEKQSCLDKLAERFDASAGIFARVGRSGTTIQVELSFVATANGRTLDSVEKEYESGREGDLTTLILDRLDDNLVAAASEEEVDDNYFEDDRDDHSGPGGVSVHRDGDADTSDRDRADTSDRDRADTSDRDRADTSDRDRADDRDRDRADTSDRRYRDRERADDRDRDRERDRINDRDRDRAGDRADTSDRRYRNRDRDDSGDRSMTKDNENAQKERARKERTRKDKDETRTRDKDRDHDPRKDRDADAREGDDKPLIDPVLLESFDDGEDDRYNETGRSSAGDLSFEDAQERGMTAVEYHQFQRSGASYDSWQERRFSHKGKFHLRFAGFYAMGGIDMYYSERAVLNSTEVLERYWWQSFGMRAASGGGTFGLGFGVAAPVDISVEFSLLYGEQWLMREYRNPDGSQSTIDTHNEDNPIPRGPAMHVLIEPKGRFYFTPHKAVKPYGGFGVALFFMPPFEVPEEWAQDRPGTFVLGLEPALGVQFDTPVGLGFFIEAPFTIYLATDHGIEQGTSGSTAYLTEEEKNLPPDPASVPRFMLRAQVGVQIRM